MLATEKIADAFKAIVEEAEKIAASESAEDAVRGARTIISIARHQSDIRGAKEGSCTAKSHCGRKE